MLVHLYQFIHQTFSVYYNPKLVIQKEGNNKHKTY